MYVNIIHWLLFKTVIQSISNHMHISLLHIFFKFWHAPNWHTQFCHCVFAIAVRIQPFCWGLVWTNVNYRVCTRQWGVFLILYQNVGSQASPCDIRYRSHYGLEVVIAKVVEYSLILHHVQHYVEEIISTRNIYGTINQQHTCWSHQPS